MCAISDLDDSSGGGEPAWLWIPPEEFEVDDRVWWSAFYEFSEDGCPFFLLHALHFVHSLQHFLVFDCIVPVFRFTTRGLLSVSRIQLWLRLPSHRDSLSKP